jgi:hypothetical protein
MPSRRRTDSLAAGPLSANHPHPLGRGAHLVDEGRGLGGRPGQQGVRLGGEEHLAAQPRLRLELLTGRDRAVLHRRDRVEALHERDAELDGHRQGGDSAEPVVRVDHVVAAAGAAECRDRLAELVGDDREGRLVDRPLAARGQLVHQNAVRNLAHHRLTLRPGEQVHLDPAGGDLLGDRQEQNIHAARVAGAGIRKGRGVHGDHRDARSGAPHSPTVLPGARMTLGGS